MLYLNCRKRANSLEKNIDRKMKFKFCANTLNFFQNNILNVIPTELSVHIDHAHEIFTQTHFQIFFNIWNLLSYVVLV